jgi:hypothetical protein
MDQKKLILALIKDDLIHAKLLYSFEKLGFYSDCYSLHLSSTIIEMMGYKNDEGSDLVFERYMVLSEKAVLIDITESNKPMEKLALAIYKELLIKRKKQNIK